MYNISQITNFSDEVSQGSKRYYSIKFGETTKTVLYRRISCSILTGSSSIPINKIGYVCEPKGIDYPIKIETGGEIREIAIGKTGMYETMPEIFSDINDSDAEDLECTPEITTIEVPIGISEGYKTPSSPIKFKLDYVYSIN